MDHWTFSVRFLYGNCKLKNTTATTISKAECHWKEMFNKYFRNENINYTLLPTQCTNCLWLPEGLFTYIYTPFLIREKDRKPICVKLNWITSHISHTDVYYVYGIQKWCSFSLQKSTARYVSNYVSFTHRHRVSVLNSKCLELWLWTVDLWFRSFLKMQLQATLVTHSIYHIR